MWLLESYAWIHAVCTLLSREALILSGGTMSLYSALATSIHCLEQCLAHNGMPAGSLFVVGSREHVCVGRKDTSIPPIPNTSIQQQSLLHLNLFVLLGFPLFHPDVWYWSLSLHPASVVVQAQRPMVVVAGWLIFLLSLPVQDRQGNQHPRHLSALGLSSWLVLLPPDLSGRKHLGSQLPGG